VIPRQFQLVIHAAFVAMGPSRHCCGCAYAYGTPQAMIALYRLEARVPRTWVDHVAVVRRVVDTGSYAQLSMDFQQGLRDGSEVFEEDPAAYEKYMDAANSLLRDQQSQAEDLATWLTALRTTSK
jgi:hypothetical protein